MYQCVRVYVRPYVCAAERVCVCVCLCVCSCVCMCVCACVCVCLSLHPPPTRRPLPIIYISAAVKRGVSVLRTRTTVNNAVVQSSPPVQLRRCRGTAQNYTGRQVREALLTRTGMLDYR